MQKVIVVVALAALVATACGGAGVDRGSGSSAQGAQPPAGTAPPHAATGALPKACGIITPAEIAQALQVPDVKKDDVNSGENTTTRVDICNWYVKSGSTEGVQVQVYRGQGVGLDASLAAYTSAKGDAVEHDSTRAAQAQQLTGIGDEAIYSPYPEGKGGNIAFRTRAGAVTITGSAARDRLESIAKLAASRM